MIAVTKSKDSVSTRASIRSIRKAAGAFVLASVLTFFLVSFTTRFYRIDLSIPLWYYSDTGFYLMLIKGLINNEWYPFSVPHSTHLGAPFGSSLYDFPGVADSNLLFLILKVITFFTKEVGRVYNYYSLLTYFLVVFTSIFAIRHYRVSFKVAMVFSLLFSFLPYHFLRMRGHLNIVLYLLVPLYILILTWIWSRKPIFFKRRDNRYVLDFKSYKARFALIVLALSGTTAIYFNFFFCLLAGVAGASAALYRKSRYHLITAFMLISMVGVSVSAALVPYLKYRIENGRNTETAVRSHLEAEVYGLKIVQLLLPANWHRIPTLSRVTEKYYTGSEPSETSWATLGTFGSLGFLFLLFYFLAPMRKSSSVYYRLGLMALTGVLFATTGGFASLFALLIFPTLRSYTRISIFIAFMSFLPVAFAVDRIQKRLSPLPAHGLMATILVIGILDQTNHYYKYTVDHEYIKEEYLSDRAFVKAIEGIAPKGASIFQLPYLAFPESGALNAMSDYEPLKGYVHSDTLNWSYGSIKGRVADRWYEEMADQPFDQMLHKLSIVGFSGLYIDRFGYKDKGAAVEARLADLLQKPPIVSQNERLAYFDIAPYAENILKSMDKATLENMKDSVLHMLEQRWEGECSAMERDNERRWRWCGNNARLTLINHSSLPRRQQIRMEIHPGPASPYNLWIGVNNDKKQITLEGEVKQYQRVLEIPPHSSIALDFYSDGESLSVPNDNRKLVFAVYNLELVDLTDPSAEDGSAVVTWTDGCYPLEKNPLETWHWCGHDGGITLVNRTGAQLTRLLAMEFRPNRPDPYQVTIKGERFSDTISVSRSMETYQKTITLPAHGFVTLRFHSDAEPLRIANETRPIVFAVYNLKIRDTTDKTTDSMTAKGRIQEAWEGDCFPLEENGPETWHWCGNDGRVTLVNPTDNVRNERVTMEFPPNRPDPYEVVIKGKGFHNVIKVQGRTERIEQTLTIPPNGKTVIEMHSNAKPLTVPNEPRKLVFAVYNFEVKDKDPR